METDKRFYVGLIAGVLLLSLLVSGIYFVSAQTINEDLIVKGNEINLGLGANGGGQLILSHNVNDNSIYLEGFSTNGEGNADAIYITGRYTGNIPKIILSSDKVGIGTVDPKVKFDVAGPVKINYGGDYDVWIQGGGDSTDSGATRNLAIVGLSESRGDKLIINYAGEYSGGTSIGSNLEIGGNLDVNRDGKFSGTVTISKLCFTDGSCITSAKQLAGSTMIAQNVASPAATPSAVTPPAPAGSVDLKVNGMDSGNVPADTDLTLSWNNKEVSECTVYSPSGMPTVDSAHVGLTGTSNYKFGVSQIEESGEFKMTCKGTNGVSVSDSVSVTVVEKSAGTTAQTTEPAATPEQTPAETPQAPVVETPNREGWVGARPFEIGNKVCRLLNKDCEDTSFGGCGAKAGILGCKSCVKCVPLREPKCTWESLPGWWAKAGNGVCASLGKTCTSVKDGASCTSGNLFGCKSCVNCCTA